MSLQFVEAIIQCRENFILKSLITSVSKLSNKATKQHL